MRKLFQKKELILHRLTLQIRQRVLSSQSSSAPSSGAEAATSAPTSVFGSIAMVPVAAVGLTQVVNKLTESSPYVCT